ncbi:unnamed protein product [Closterium sp. Naga37s-1]|nr:unnamed protein product [Closterium sp. Naga37s-1]
MAPERKGSLKTSSDVFQGLYKGADILFIPVYHVLKRLTPVMVLCAKYLIGDGSPPLEVCMSVLAVVSGCFLAGAGDLSFDARGYLWAITIGFFVLGGVKATPLIVAGSSVNTVGGVWYTYAKYKAKNAQQAERAEQVKAHSSPRMSEDKV